MRRHSRPRHILLPCPSPPCWTGTGLGGAWAPGEELALLLELAQARLLCHLTRRRSRTGTQRALGARGADREEAGGRKVWAVMLAGIAGAGVGKG